MAHKTVSALMLAGLLAGSALPAAAEGWLDDFAAARKAAAPGKTVFVAVNGPDWSIPGQQMEAEVYSRSEFTVPASKTSVLVRIDFPRAWSLPEAQTARNRQWSVDHPFDSVPACFLFDSQGNVLGLREGLIPGGPAAVLALIHDWSSRQPVLTGLRTALAKAAPGAARAQALDALYRQAEQWGLTSQMAAVPTQIVQEDKDGKAGLKPRYQVIVSYQRMLLTWAASDDYRRSAQDFQTLADKSAAWPELQQQVLFTRAMVLLNAVRDETAARDAFRQVRAQNPDSPAGKRAAELLDGLP